VKTLDISEAAQFLKMNPEVLRRKAKLNQVPGRKTGRSWVFIEEQLAQWIKEDYIERRRELRVVDPKPEKHTWQSTHAVKTKPGGSDSPRQTAESLYKRLLAPLTNGRHKSSTTD
jgi:hypothetical protein